MTGKNRTTAEDFAKAALAALLAEIAMINAPRRRISMGCCLLMCSCGSRLIRWV